MCIASACVRTWLLASLCCVKAAQLFHSQCWFVVQTLSSLLSVTVFIGSIAHTSCRCCSAMRHCFWLMAVFLWMSVCVTCLLTERQPGSAPRRHDRLRRHCQSSHRCRLKHRCPGQGNWQSTCSVVRQIVFLHSEYQEHHTYRDCF